MPMSRRRITLLSATFTNPVRCDLSNHVRVFILSHVHRSNPSDKKILLCPTQSVGPSLHSDTAAFGHLGCLPWLMQQKQLREAEWPQLVDAGVAAMRTDIMSHFCRSILLSPDVDSLSSEPQGLLLERVSSRTATEPRSDFFTV
ncbi:hypothetical protein AcV7_006195 [Taiwanofungus camphoratus]|nr:hypothetical protein AcV7_006195 [Antrodia cinnamomea]